MLSTDTGIAELKRLAEYLPAVPPVLLKYGQAVKRCERLDELAGCLEVRAKGSF